MIYKALYEMNENDDALHIGISDVQVAEEELAPLLASLSKDLRDRADAIIGKLARAYELQGFLFGGAVAGAAWNRRTRPLTGQTYSPSQYRGSTPAPVCKIERGTGRVLAEYKSLSAAARENGLDDSAIGKACKGKIPSCGGYLWRYMDA